MLYEDEEVLALNKPAGLAVQGGDQDHPPHRQAAQRLGRGRGPAKAGAPPGPRHFGRAAAGQDPGRRRAPVGAFAKRRAQKTYWAIVAGNPHPTEGVIELHLAKRGVGDRELVVPAEPKDPDAQPAETEFVSISRAGPRVTWMALRPHTGRTHQLRAHMKAIGHPILGDPKYSDDKSTPLSEGLKLQLHARSIILPHPSVGTLAIERRSAPR